MPDEITFFDLTALMKIKPGITVERYGGLINSSFFDGAKVLGTLQQKKLISLSTAMPDQNPITVTDTGKQLLGEAETRSKQEFDHLDLSILTQVSTGKSSPDEIGKSVNVRPKDLAMHLYKMVQQDFATYEFVSGNVNVMLTEKGFTQTKTGMPVKPKPATPPPAAMAMQNAKMPMAQPPEPTTKEDSTMTATPMDQSMQQTPQPGMGGGMGATPTDMSMKSRGGGGKGKLVIAIIIIVIIIIALAYLYMKGTI